MIRARLNIPVRNRQVANSLAKAVEPDNKMPGLQIVERPKLGFLALDMQFDGGVETFIFTLDDMLACLQAAMETLDKMKTEDTE